MMEIADAVVVELAEVVAGAIPLLADRIPVGPAAQLGRAGAPDDPGLRSTDPPLRQVGVPVAPRAGQASAMRVAAVRVHPGPVTAGTFDESVAVAALRGLGPLLAERLLGALELTVADLDLPGVPDLSPYLRQTRTGWFAYGSVGPQSETVTAAGMLDRLYPGSIDLIVSLTRRLATHPSVAPLLAVVADGADESTIAARHGAAYLALAVATAAALVGQVPAAALDRPAAVVGAALGTAAVLLREAPMPPAYGTAVLAKVRAEYLLPRSASGSVPVAGHRFALVEGGIPDPVDFSGNGLVAVVAGGVVIRTGIGAGTVRVLLTVLAEPPQTVERGWEEVVEVSWRAAAGRASVVGPDGPGDRQLLCQTPPWPGDYRLRVHARGRDDDDVGAESYQLVVWQAPAAPEIVYRRTDRLGHRLRGEPEPERADRPELAYRWMRRGALADAATVTVVTGATVEVVLRAFGADPAEAESMRELADDLDRQGSIAPWVAVLDTGQAVFAVEYNGYQGSHEPVLRQASARGRAASMFWNINAVTRLSFAEGGRLLASFEPPAEADGGPAVAEALAGLDFHQPGDTAGKGLVAVERFTGRGITAEDLAHIEGAGIAFRIVPHLPVLYPYHPARIGRRPADLDIAALERLPQARLRDLAWWAAAEAARYAGLADDSDIAASIAGRALTPDAAWRARRSQLPGGSHPWLWRALHAATNPDPLAAVTGTLDAARYAAGPHAAELIENARTRMAVS